MHVVKRDGQSIQAFDGVKIFHAIKSAFESLYGDNFEEKIIHGLVHDITNAVKAVYGNLAHVEEIQDIVTMYLESVDKQVSESFANYRFEQARERLAGTTEYFDSDLSRFVFYDKYSRWNNVLHRRETWDESVARVMDYMRWLSSYQLKEETYQELEEAIRNQEIAPSMRVMNMGGEVSKKLPESVFNCSYLPIADLDSFVELMWLSMAGAGVGYSVEKEYVNQLPIVNVVHPMDRHVYNFRIEDSAEGWCDALKFGLSIWTSGHEVNFDYSLIRPHGAPLKTKGGTASGYKVFKETLDAIRDIILLQVYENDGVFKSIHAHDICCHIANAVVQGNVRRSALISLFDYDDLDMLLCKTPKELFEKGNLQRFRANNSVVIEDELGLSEIDSLIKIMDKSGTSEPGIFSRYAIRNTIPKRRLDINKNTKFGVNPCGEVFLRPYEVCNLSSVIVRPNDDKESLLRKIRLATILGTIQSIATDGFNKKYLREEWRKNGREERLLGVDLNGIQDNYELFNDEEGLFYLLRNEALKTNEEVAKQLGINPSSAITTIKPSGNASSLYNTSAGIHPRYAPYYIRRVRLSANTLMHDVFKNSGFPLVPDVDQRDKPMDEVTTWVAEFPIMSPKTATKFSKDFTGVDFLEFWLKAKTGYTEHNPSVTISYKEKELDDMILWLYENQGYTSGISFSKLDNTGYELAPYEEIDEETYYKLIESVTQIDWSLIALEKRDTTSVSEGALACGGGLCLV